MSIVYQYYKQGSSHVLTYGTSASTLQNFNYQSMNHFVVTPTVDCYVSVYQLESAPIATSTSSQFVMARTETLLPCIKGRTLSVVGSAAGTLYITEYWSA